MAYAASFANAAAVMAPTIGDGGEGADSLRGMAARLGGSRVALATLMYAPMPVQDCLLAARAHGQPPGAPLPHPLILDLKTITCTEYENVGKHQQLITE
jgi:hypothetical protein